MLEPVLEGFAVRPRPRQREPDCGRRNRGIDVVVAMVCAMEGVVSPDSGNRRRWLVEAVAALSDHCEWYSGKPSGRNVAGA